MITEFGVIMAKAIARTLSQIRDNPVVAVAFDPSKPIDPVAEETLKAWRVRDIDKKHPLPPSAYVGEESPAIHGFSMLEYALALEGIIVEIPHYRSMRVPSRTPDQKVVSSEHRHGPLLGVISNSKTHAFSLRIEDHNVVDLRRNLPYAPRNFAVVFDSGEFWEGSSTLRYFRDARMDEFLKSRQLPPGNAIEFQNFVNPNLWIAVYGAPYISAKILLERITHEAWFYRRLAKFLSTHILWPSRPLKERRAEESPEETKPVLPPVELEKKPIRVLKARVWAPEFSDGYPRNYPIRDEEGNVYQKSDLSKLSIERIRSIVRYARKRANHLSYGIGPRVRTIIRAPEYALLEYGFSLGLNFSGNEKDPGWAVPEWDRGYSGRGRERTRWDGALHLTFTQDGKRDITWAYRFRDTVGYKRLLK